MTIQVKEATTKEDKDAVYHLRYKVFVEELHLFPEHALHDSKQLIEPCDSYAHNFFAVENGKVVGALRVNLSKDGPVHHENFYELDGFKPYYPGHTAMFTKFAISQSHSGGSIVKELLLACYEFARKQKCQYVFIDSWAHLVTLFEHLGFRQYMSNINHPESGYATPMVLVTEDTNHFDTVCSPFVEIAVKFPNAPDAAQHYKKVFSRYADREIKLSMSNDDAFDLISEKISATIGDTVNLFKSMSKEEVQLITSLGKIKKYKNGDKIITFGDSKNEIYTLLSGEVSVCHEIEGIINQICSFSEGETFGEVAYLAETTRSSDVIAMSPADVLVHDLNNLENIERNFPVIAAKIYRNLARIVSVRLIKTSQGASALRASLKYHMTLKHKNRQDTPVK
ncbi:MAG: cyclic nucleotide-binding domain-containing protein [Deltaproteobacteria bacterium]|nr:cyclic nucleotide-binding domain-containing protein [Deltaproteobacteria bacterium]